MQSPARLAVCCLLLAFAAPLSAQSATPDAALTVPSAVPFAAPASAPTAQSSQASAPEMPTSTPAASESQSVAGAPITDARVAVHAPERARDASAATAAAHANLGQARALMVVGVAGLLVGAIIGGTPGTIIMIGGAVIGLKGLYDYLQ